MTLYGVFDYANKSFQGGLHPDFEAAAHEARKFAGGGFEYTVVKVAPAEATAAKPAPKAKPKAKKPAAKPTAKAKKK